MQKLEDACSRVGIQPGTGRMYCRQGRWPGAVKNQYGGWEVPEDSEPDTKRSPQNLPLAKKREIGQRKLDGESAASLAEESGITTNYVFALAKKVKDGARMRG